MKISDQIDIVDAADAGLLKADELARVTPFGLRTIRKWYAEGIIPAAVAEGRKVLFRKADVLAALAVRADEQRKARVKRRKRGEALVI